MANYTAIMIHAYGRATGKTIQQSIIDLNIDGLISAGDIEPLDIEGRGLVEVLASDVPGVVAWGGVVGHDEEKNGSQTLRLPDRHR